MNLQLSPYNQARETIMGLMANPTLRNSVSEFPVELHGNLMEPGLINYDDVKDAAGNGMGNVMITKETLDKFMSKFVGKYICMPKDHIKGVKPEDFQQCAVGICNRVEWNPATNWYECWFFLWDDAAIDKAKNGWSLSSSYDPKLTGTGGKHNGIGYNNTVCDGEPNHIALVPKPRYSGSQILLNSIQEGSMKVTLWLRKKAGQAADVLQRLANATPEDSMVEIDGVQVSMKDLIATYEAEQAEIAKKAELDAANAAASDKAEVDGDTSKVKIGDKDVALKDLMNSYRNRKPAANADSAKPAEAPAPAPKPAEPKPAEPVKPAVPNEAPVETEEEKAAKAKAAKEKEDAEKAKLSNQAPAPKGPDYFMELHQAATARTEKVENHLLTREEKQQRGREMFGSK